MRKLRGIPKILKINDIKGYQVSLLFNNGASGLVDFQAFWKDKKANHPAFKFLIAFTKYPTAAVANDSIDSITF